MLTIFRVLCIHSVCVNANTDVLFYLQLKTEVPLNLEHTIACFSVLTTPQFAEVVKRQLHHHILEGLISHFFPETDSLYSKDDVEYFISFANKQTSWKHSVQTVPGPDDLVLDSCMSLSKFKFHLDKILSKGWSKNGKPSKPLNIYKSEVTILWVTTHTGTFNQFCLCRYPIVLVKQSCNGVLMLL